MLRSRQLPIFVTGLAVLFLLGSVPSADADRRSNKRDRTKRAKKQVQTEEETWRKAYENYRFGYQWFQQGLLTKAREHLEIALDLEPNYDEAAYVLSLVHLELNDHAAAIRLAERALDRNPFFTEAWNVKGLALARQGRYDEALAAFEAVKADISFPTPEIAHFNIGKVLAEMGRCDEAIRHLEKATEINEEFGKAHFLLGDCCEQVGQVGTARIHLERAAKFLADDPQVHYRLGYVCLNLGDVTCARMHLDKVRFLSPSSPLAHGARQLLEQIHFR
ncbi:MAG: tetratricopeptide repeat protein [Acidobacteriota bacterium]